MEQLRLEGSDAIAHGDARALRATVSAAAERFRLSPRQAEVLALVCEGLTNFQIGERLLVTHATVVDHVRQLRDRTNARNRTHLAAIAIRCQRDR